MEVTHYLSIYLSIYPTVLGTVGHHTTWKPTFAFPLVPLLSSRRSVPNPSNPTCYLPIVFSVCLSCYLPVQCHGGLSWQVPKLLLHAIPLHFASFYSGQEFFVGSSGFPNSASHLFVCNVIFVRDAKETYDTSHFHCLYLSLYFCC